MKCLISKDKREKIFSFCDYYGRKKARKYNNECQIKKYKIHKNKYFDGYCVLVKSNSKWKRIYQTDIMDDVRIFLLFKTKKLSQEFINKIKNGDVLFLEEDAVYNGLSDG